MRIVVAAAILGLGIIPAHANDELEFCAIVINAPAGYIVLHDGPGSEFGTRAKLVVDDFLYAARAGAASGRRRVHRQPSLPLLARADEVIE